MQNKVESQLLPEGFRDSLPGMAEKEYKVNSIFIEIMEMNGFSLVKPPLLEFEDSLFFLNNDREEINSFRLLDPISQKMMGLRSDITLQIARISCGTLKREIRPLRLIYSGEVLRIKNNSLNMSRQATQIGAEIIGVKNFSCENELTKLIIDILVKLKIKNFFISFSIPTLVSALEKDFNLDKKQLKLLIENFKNKNLTDLDKISDKLMNVSSMLLSSVGEAGINLKKIKKFRFPHNTQNEINNFIKIITKLSKEFKDVKILIDPLEIDESEYHSGIIFKVYSSNFKELFSGGKYCVYEENCIGFSGFLENLVLESNIKFNKKKRIYVPYDILDTEKQKLISSGYMVIRAIGKHGDKSLLNMARKNRCSYIFRKKKIFKTEK